MCSYIDNFRFQYFLAVALSCHGCPLLTGILVHCSGRGVELYLGGAGERPPTSSSPTWGTRGQVGAVVGPGRRRTGEGGGRAGVEEETR
jgi:hypothetical protein